MDSHQASLELGLMGGEIAPNPLTGSPQPRGPCKFYKNSLILVMGLTIVALVTGFSLFVMPSFNQSAKMTSASANLILTSKLKVRDATGRHHIFTAEKASSYLIYGWVRFSETTGEDLTLVVNANQSSRTLQKKKLNKKEIFFFEKAQLTENMTVSLSFKNNFTDSFFHLYEVSPAPG